MTLLLLLLTIFSGAIITAWVARFGRLYAAWAAGLFTLLGLAQLAPRIPAVFDGHTTIERWEWMPASGLDLVFR
ncbi:MAG: hypothetical protein LPK58_08185, partial [Gammaproteobacteria bacterium]|nr:hypothetical protein [Gammaproteobacteria bacterium]MDX5375518.1 hypothetical protein [Gammaproteobacteria bacterium]MDX5503457.1 hypothetical protein [Halomonas sp.]